MNHREKLPDFLAIGSPRVKAEAVHPLPTGSIVLSLPRAPMRQRFYRKSGCLTACHSILPSPSLTGWTAIRLGVYQCRFFSGSADSSRKLTRPDGWRGKVDRHEKSRLKEHPLVVTLSNTFYAYWTEQKILIQTANLLLTTATTPLYTKKRPDARAGSNVLQHRRAS